MVLKMDAPEENVFKNYGEKLGIPLGACLSEIYLQHVLTKIKMFRNLIGPCFCTFVSQNPVVKNPDLISICKFISLHPDDTRCGTNHYLGSLPQVQQPFLAS